MELQTINQVSRDYGISARMLRYYEKIGLIQSLRKEDYAYRVYDETALRRIQQIVILRKLRVSMKQIGVILSEPKAAEAIEIFKQNISELDGEINSLSIIRNILVRLAAELQEQANIRLGIEALIDSSVLSIVNSLSLSKNYIKENMKMDDLRKADEKLSKLTDENIRIVYLPPSAVASVCCYGDEAETDSDKAMGKFAEETDLFKKNPNVRFYGFNNPVFEGEKFIKQGYEVWATIPDDFPVPPTLVKKHFTGGLYAAYTSKPVSFDEWKPFCEWLKASDDFEYDSRPPYENNKIGACSGWGRLEEHINSYNVYGLKNRKHILTHIDFLMPIKEKED